MHMVNTDDVLETLVDDVVGRYRSTGNIKAVARELKMSPLKVRKLLITGGAFQNGKSMEVGKLLDGGYPLEEIERRTGLGRASVYSYIPYRKSAYKTDAIAVSGNAKRIRSFRKGWDERQRMSVMAEASSFPPSGCGEVITDTATGLNVQPWLYGRYHAAAIAATGLACSVPPALEGKRCVRNTLWDLCLNVSHLESLSRCVRPERSLPFPDRTIREMLKGFGMDGLLAVSFSSFPGTIPSSGREFDLLMPNGLPFRSWFLEKTVRVGEATATLERYLGDFHPDVLSLPEIRLYMENLRRETLYAYAYLRYKGTRKDPFRAVSPCLSDT